MNSIIPNLFIIGAPKAGTTALANNLAQHKKIYISELKEPRYFDAHTFYDNKSDYLIKNIEEYLELFNNLEAKKSKYRLDASVFNMYSEMSIKNILQLSPDAKFIIILREPVSASVSMHSQRLAYSDPKMRELSEDFKECWKMLKGRKQGLYYPKACQNKILFRYDLLYSYELYIPQIQNLIESKNLFIGFYEDFKNSPDKFYYDIFNFLNIEHIKLQNRKHNKSLILKKSIFLEVLEIISLKSFKIREKIGLTGGLLYQFKQWFINRKKIAPKVLDNSDLNEVEEFFEKTNTYLRELKEN